jgi:hypothetical protein
MQLRIKMIRSALLVLVHVPLLLLIALSLIHVLPTITDLIQHISKTESPIFAAALASGLLPAGLVIFWSFKAIIIGFDDYCRQLVILPASFRASLPASPSQRFARGRRMSDEAVARLWMSAAFCAQLALAIVILAVKGTGSPGMSTALQTTGRLSFLLFWPAYASGAMATLFGPRFGKVARHSRNMGLAYAAAQAVHVALVAWLLLGKDEPVLQSFMPFFAIGVVWTYVLALFSVERLSNFCSANLLRSVRNIGLEYIILVFFADLVIGPIVTRTPHPMDYVPFSILLVLGLLLRLAAIAKRSLLRSHANFSRTTASGND